MKAYPVDAFATDVTESDQSYHKMLNRDSYAEVEGQATIMVLMDYKQVYRIVELPAESHRPKWKEDNQ
jgi:hypothetical protein